MKRFLALVTGLVLSITSAHAAPQVDVTGGNGSTPASVTNPIPTTTSARSSYAASTGYFTPVATPTDVVSIFGSASKTIRVLRVTVTSTQTTAGVNQWFLLKRSTANTGGTPTAATGVPLDSGNAAATAVVNQYTANPTTGSLVGKVKVSNILSPAPASVSGGESILHEELYNGQGIVLRGTAEGLVLNFNGAAVPTGLSMAVNIFWTEE